MAFSCLFNPFAQGQSKQSTQNKSTLSNPQKNTPEKKNKKNKSATSDPQTQGPLNVVQGQIGRGHKSIQKTTCLLTVKTQGLQAGDLADVVDQTNTRVAVVRLEHMSQTSGVLVARVLVGEDRCKTLAGFSIIPITTQDSVSIISSSKKKDSTLFFAPQLTVTQNSLPGLALNKFMSPGYTQRGFGVKLSGIFPQKPVKMKQALIQGQADAQWSTNSTSPSIDLIKDNVVQGTQKIATNSLRLKAGGRFISLKGQLWTSVGALLLDSFETKSELAAAAQGKDKLFASIRDIKGRGFGLYLEQGAIFNNSARFSLYTGFNFSQSAQTPIVEDGESTNTTESFKMTSTPVIAGAHLMIPILDWFFADVNLDYRTLSMQLPLVNSKETKVQYETLTFATSVGVRF